MVNASHHPRTVDHAALPPHPPRRRRKPPPEIRHRRPDWPPKATLGAAAAPVARLDLLQQLGGSPSDLAGNDRGT